MHHCSAEKTVREALFELVLAELGRIKDSKGPPSSDPWFYTLTEPRRIIQIMTPIWDRYSEFVTNTGIV